MKYRKLRIAFSAVCGVLCLLLIVLWVRSYYAEVSITVLRKLGKPVSHFTKIRVSESDIILRNEHHFTQGTISSMNSEQYRLPLIANIVGILLLSAMPWIRWRFSLRTLLIATTLVAILLGLIVYAAS
jgi:hypothetical protein